jgi:PhnB protein
MYMPPGLSTVAPYGDRLGGVRDAQGNLWWISQRLVEAP